MTGLRQTEATMEPWVPQIETYRLLVDFFVC
jgi:hypothetical protein